MAGNIPMGSMSTEIKLNGSQSVRTLRELKQAVTQATSAWKAQRAELSTIGKSTEAAEAKYKGLAETIKKQKDYISGLQEAQKHLTEAQKSVDRSTREGRQEYGKYNEALQKNETRLHSAQQKLASLADQQSKAKKSVDYYKSGLAEAQKQLKLNELVTKSYVARLSSEGKNYEAAKVKLNGYRNSIENLTKQQKIQEQELSKIASESGKSSEAYKRQQVRVNETAASLAKAKTQMTELDNSMRKANPSFLDRIRSKLTGVNKEADKTHHTFREVFMGSALGTALTNSLSNIGGQLQSIYKDGMEANSIAGKIDARFKNMGQSASGIKRLDAQIKELKYNTGMSADQIADLQTKMLNWSVIGQKGALQMTKAIAGIGDSSKMPADQIARMGASLMRVGSTGKVTYSALNRITKSAPAFYSQLAKGAGMSESKLKSLLQSGNVTQKQFQKWLAASSKYSDEAFKGYNATQAGAINRMQKAWADLKKTMTAPLFKAKSTGLQALSQLLTSKELMSGAKTIGQGISQAIGIIYKHRKDITDVAKDFIQLGVSVGKAVWKDFLAIFVDIAKSFHLISGNSKSAGGPMHQLRLAMDKLAKNKTAIQIIAKAIELIAVAKLANAADGLFHISKIAKGSADALIGLTKGFKDVDDVSKLEGTQKTFYKLADSLKNSKLADLATKAGNGIANGFHKGLEGISKATSWLGKTLLSAGKSLVSKAATLGKNIGNAITKAVKATMKFSMGKRLATGALAGAAVAAPEVVNAIKDRHNANKRSQDIGGAVGALAGGTLTSMIPVVGPLLAPVGAIIGKYAGQWGGKAVNNFTKGWQRNKPPKKFWSLENLGYSAHNMWSGFTKGFHKWVDDLVKGFKKAWVGVGKWFGNIGKSIQEVWNGMWKSINSNRYVKAFKRGKFFSTALNDMKSRWSSFKNWLGKKWDSFWKLTQKWAKKSWNGTVKNWNGMWKSINSSWKSFKTSLGNGWRSFWDGLADFFRNIWKLIKRIASGGINGIVGVINGGISGIDNVIHSFGGKSHAISLIPKVKLATGTLGGLTPSITQPTLALLNDGHDSPETGNKETIWDTTTGALSVVKGTNVPVVLQPGMEVFSASQSRNLGFTHFANGTNPLAKIGKFFGGIGSWIGQKTSQLKKWFELATKIVSHPIQALSSLMYPSSKGLNGIFVQLDKGMFDKSKDAAKEWWSTLWNMASSKLNGDDEPATGLLKAVEKYGENHKYVWGAAGPSSFDCSGLVMYALKHAYGIDFPHFSGSQYDMTQHISRDQARVGDLVFWGNHGDDHEGVYAGGNKYFSAQSPSQGIHMNTLDSVVGKGKPLFGRVRGLSQNNKKEAVKTANGLQKMIKNQVGNGFFKFMSKLGDLFGITGKAGMPTGDHTNWMKQAHIPRSDWAGIDYIVTHESGWNPRINNPSSGTYGLGQMQSYNLHYYTAHGSKSNPIAQLMGMMDYIRDRYGTVSNAVAFWKQNHSYANGGIANTPSIFGEAGPEMAIPLIPSKSTRAWELIGKAVGILSANSNFNNQQQVNSKEQKEEHDFRQAVLLLLTEIAGKSDVAKITLTTPAGRALWSIIQPFQKQDMKSEIARLRMGLSGGR